MSIRWDALPTLYNSGPKSERCIAIDWNKLTDNDIHKYVVSAREKIDAIYVPTDVITCNNSCCGGNHLSELTTYYDSIVCALSSAGVDTIAKSKKRCDFIVPGWNDCVSDLYALSRTSFLLWREQGSPRCGPTADFMRRSRRQFRYALSV